MYGVQKTAKMINIRHTFMFFCRYNKTLNVLLWRIVENDASGQGRPYSCAGPVCNLCDIALFGVLDSERDNKQLLIL